ncbi:MAG TPA: hypothetical protein VD994_21170, partial [Prosthecobacter sp.]|nr:hypothetical protein [Prosthecobacter sp.]
QWLGENQRFAVATGLEGSGLRLRLGLGIWAVLIRNHAQRVMGLAPGAAGLSLNRLQRQPAESTGIRKSGEAREGRLPRKRGTVKI